MSTYKVIQDIEAEDKIIGPLTLRQFIYAGIAAIAGYFSFVSINKHVPFMLILFLPIVGIGGFFAFPWKGEQPTEIWALAKVRFLLKPRKRIWDQNGAKHLVTITAPPKVQVDFTNGLNQTEVHSRLRALADTIDSRGWAIKNSNLNSYAEPALVMAEPTSDRLLGPSSLPQEVEPVDIHASDDMLDEANNPRAQAVDSLIERSAKAHRNKIMEALQRPEPPASMPAPAQPPNNYWFLNQGGQSSSVPNNMVTFNTQVVTPGVNTNAAPANTSAPQPVAAAEPAMDERQLVQQLEQRKKELPMAAYYGHLHTINPLSAQPQAPSQAMPMPAQPFAAVQPVTNRPTATPQMPAAQPYPNPFSPQQASVNDTPAPNPFPANTPSNMPAPAAPTIARSQSQTVPQPVTPAQQAAILQLANNDDLNVATLAREANRSGSLDGEVVIKLH